MGALIQELIRDGNLKLWIAPKAGHFVDLSGNSNDGTPDPGAIWARYALNCKNGPLGIQVADSAELQLTAGALVLFGQFDQPAARVSLIAKRDGGGTNYDWRMTATSMEMYDGAINRSRVMTIDSARCLALNMPGGGAVCDAYMDGLLEGPLSGVNTFTADNAVINIAGYFAGGRNLHSPVEHALIINRVLTAAEHALLYAELANLTWPTKLVSSASHPDAPKVIQFKTDWGFRVSPAPEGGILHQVVGGGGSPFRAGDVGFRGVIETDTVNGRLCKVLRCTVAGAVYVSRELFYDCSPTEAAFGSWDLWAYKANASVLDINLLSNLNTVITTGYGLTWAADESVVVTEYGVGSVVTGGTASHSTWHRFRLTRSSAGMFTPYIDRVGFGTPAIDLTTTTADYMLFDMDAGDKICIGSISGDECVCKMLGVVTP